MKRLLLTLVACLIPLTAGIQGQLVQGIALYSTQPSVPVAPSASGVIYVAPAPTGSSGNNGTYNFPYDWTTATSFSNVYICRRTGTYVEFTPSLSITNPYEPPDLFTNSPVAGYPMDYDVVEWRVP